MEEKFANIRDDEILDLSSSRIDGIGVGYEIPNSIKILDLTHVTCRKLENLDNLTTLQKLCLRQNLITKIENLEKLSSLQELDLYDNQISKMENLNLPSLEKLDLSFNEIHSIVSCLSCVAPRVIPSQQQDKNNKRGIETNDKPHTP